MTPQRPIEETVCQQVSQLLLDPDRMRKIQADLDSTQLKDKSGLKNQAKQIERQIAKIRQKQETLLARFVDLDENFAEVVERQIRVLADESRRLTEELKAISTKISLSSAHQLHWRKLRESIPDLEPGEFVLSDWRETFLALGLRVTTDGVKDWKIEFTVEAPENEYGSSGLSVLLFEAQRLNLPDGRRRKS